MFSKHTSHQYMLTAALLTAPLYAADQQQQAQPETLLKFVHRSHTELISLATGDRLTGPQATDLSGQNPVHNQLNSIYEQLKIKFAQSAPKPQDNDDKFVFLKLCTFANKNIMELALQYYDPNTALDPHGNTPLMLTVCFGNHAGTQTLLEKGADPLATNNKKESWADHATRFKNELREAQQAGPSATEATANLSAFILYAKMRYTQGDPFEACKQLVLQKQAELSS